MNDRYSRQILFSPIGSSGQKVLGQARVVIVGCGALGSVAAEQLVRAGVGSLKLIDRDFVEWSNLQRQSLYTEDDARLSLPKAVAAQAVLSSMNSLVQIEGIVKDLTFHNIGTLCRDSDLIVDGTDNFESRYLINDYSIQTGCKWVYGACLGSYGTSFAFRPGVTPCLQCLFPKPPKPGETETCDTVGILAPVVHIVASYQVAQALRILVGSDPIPKLLKVDVWEDCFKLISVKGARDPKCSCCGSLSFRFLEGREMAYPVRLCGRNAVQVYPVRNGRLDLAQLARRLRSSGEVKFNKYMIRFQVNSYEIAIFSDGRSIVRGTENISEARAIYAKYIGS